MKGTKYTTKEAVMQRAQELVDARITFGELDKDGHIAGSNKGDLGQVIEANWYGYLPNNDKEPDFPEAGVELKVSPYKKTSRGYSAKERLVCDIINYLEEVDKSFVESAFWRKCKCICLLSYEHRKGVQKTDFYIDHATLLQSYPEEDLLIIQQDYEKIISKIRTGRAHELSEGDTLYLGACTKGSDKNSKREQPYGPKAMQRAYCLKTTYMTKILREYVFGQKEDEHVIKDWHVLRERTFESVIEDTIRPYFGKRRSEIMSMTGVDSTAKNANALALSGIFKIKGPLSQTEEFQRAGIIVKTVQLQRNGMPIEDMDFPTFRFKEIIQEESWEESSFRAMIEPAKFLFIVFRGERKEDPVLERIKFWNVTNEDLEKMGTVWTDTVRKIREDRVGLRRSIKSDKVYNSFITQQQSTDGLFKDIDGRIFKTDLLCHVRPHATKSAYKLNDGYMRNAQYLTSCANELPNGEWMTNQCFWFNKSYIKRILD